MSQYDLVVLVPDKNIEAAVNGILSRPQALPIRPVVYRIYIHIERDPGCYHRGHDFLKPMLGQAAHALLVFDRDGSGQESKDRVTLENEVNARLSGSGWGDRAACVIIDPELEVWVWSDSPHVATALGWDGTTQSLKESLTNEGLWPLHLAKPSDPKRTVEVTLRKSRKPKSSSLYKELASTVSLQRCSDAAFVKLRDTLTRWFTP